MLYFLIAYLFATRFLILGMWIGESFHLHLNRENNTGYLIAFVIFEICVIVSFYRCYIKKYLYKKK